MGTLEEKSPDLRDKEIKGITINLLWAIIVATALCISTVLSVYYGFKTQVAILTYQVGELKRDLEKMKDNK